MKKRILTVLLTLVFCMSFAISAFAAGANSVSYNVELSKDESVVYEDENITVIACGNEGAETVPSPRMMTYGAYWTEGSFTSGSFTVPCDRSGTVGITLKLEGDMVDTLINVKTPFGQNVPDTGLWLSAEEPEFQGYVTSPVSGDYTITFQALGNTSGMRVMCWIYY